MIPGSFKPLLWPYDFSRLDEEKDRKVIILAAINYGNLEHWRWVVGRYGREAVRQIISGVPMTEIKTRTRGLASIIFSINNFNHAPRGAD